jgi:Tol biopolymer transport system component
MGYLSPELAARADGSGSHPLWAPPDTNVFTASWSQDGNWLLVNYNDRAKDESWVAEMPSDGREAPRPLLQTRWASWTPDRRYLVGQVGGETTGAPTAAERRRVNLIAQRRWPLGGLWRQPQPVPLSIGPMSFFGPVVTPDGRKILAGGRLDRAEPLRFNRATGPFERLPGGITGGFIDYSRDGQWVAWVDATDRTLWRARREGSERLQLTLPPLEVGLARWKPDGSGVAFVGGRSADATDTVYLVSRDGGAPEALSKPDPAFVWDPCWLPDGQTLVWGNLDIARGSVRALDMKTRQVSVIPGSEHMMGPKCSPQGLILADKNWSEGWWLYHPDAQRWDEIIPAGARVELRYPTWSHDGRWIYGLSLDEHAVLRLKPEDPRPERVASLGAIDPTSPAQGSQWMGLDPDDAPLVLRNVGMWDLYVLDWEAP